MNNTWLAFGAEAIDASVALGHRLGLDTQVIVDALEAGPLVSPWQSAKLQRVVKGDFSPQFALRLALKDVRLALDALGRPPSSSPGGPNAERYGVVAWLTISRASSTRDVTSTFRKIDRRWKSTV